MDRLRRCVVCHVIKNPATQFTKDRWRCDECQQTSSTTPQANGTFFPSPSGSPAQAVTPAASVQPLANSGVASPVAAPSPQVEPASVASPAGAVLPVAARSLQAELTTVASPSGAASPVAAPSPQVEPASVASPAGAASPVAAPSPQAEPASVASPAGAVLPVAAPSPQAELTSVTSPSGAIGAAAAADNGHDPELSQANGHIYHSAVKEDPASNSASGHEDLRQVLKEWHSANDSKKVFVSVHPHVLVLDESDTSWGCDGRRLEGGCKQGCTGFGQTEGWTRFRCEMCDYDLCEGCKNAHLKDLDAVDGGSALLMSMQEKESEWVERLLKAKAAVGAVDVRGNTPLHLAAESGDTGVAKLLLEANAKLNARNNDKETPLFIASAEGHEEFVQLLLQTHLPQQGQAQSQARANLEIPDNCGMDPLHIAAQEGHSAIVSLLLAARAKVDTCYEDGKTPLAYALEGDSEELALKLIQAKANLDLIEVEDESLLHKAAKNGHAKIMKILLERGADANEENSDGDPPLWVAIENGKEDCAQLLLEAKADVDRSDMYKATALHKAATRGLADVLRQLIAAGSKLDSQNSGADTALNLAVYFGKQDCTQILLQAKANVELADTGGGGPLHWAAYRGYPEILQMLLDAGAKMNVPTSEKKTPLMRALEEKEIECAKVLLKAGAELNLKDGDGWTTLHWAAKCGDTDVLATILEKEVEVDAQDHEGETPLRIALDEEHLECAKLLLGAKAAVDIVNKYKNGPLHKAAAKGLCEIMPALLDGGAGIDAQNHEKSTPLYLALLYKNEDCAKLLLQAKADTHLLNEEGFIALHTAAEQGLSDMIPMLLEPSTLDALGNENQTPLYLALANGHEECARLLIEAKVNVNLANNDNVTPLHLAAQVGYTSIVRMLVQSGANVDARDNDGQTPLILALENYHEETAQLLVENNADLEVSNTSGLTPLHLAAQKGYTSLCQMIMKSYSKLDTQTQDGQTPLLLALSNDQEECAQLLIEAKADVEMGDNNKLTPLHLAAQKGYASLCRMISKSVSKLDNLTQDERTPLLMALSHDQEECAQLLIEAKAEVNVVDEDKNTPLHFAVSVGFTNIYRLLLDREVQLNAQNFSGFTPLTMALDCTELECAKMLIEAKADVRLATSNGDTALHLAASRNFDDIIPLLLDAGADVDAQNVNGETPLVQAVQSYNVQSATALIKENANLELRDTDGFTPLHMAAKTGSSGVAEALLNSRAKVDVVTPDGRTPLMIAIAEDSEKCTKLLLKFNPNISLMDSSGKTALHLLAEKGDEDTMRLLLDMKAKIDVQDQSGDTPIVIAARNGKSDCLKLLMKARANVQLAGNEGYTVLHLEAEKGHADIVRALLDAGSKVDAPSHQGETPLMLAAKGTKGASKGCLDCARLLLQNGANVRYRSSKTGMNSGLTALHMAAMQGNKKMLKLLLNHGAEVDHTDTDGCSPLMLAAHGNHRRCVEMLLNVGADLLHQNDRGRTALHEASANGHSNIVKELLAARADVDCADKNGWTPLMVSSSRRCAEQLLKAGATVSHRSSDRKTILHHAAQEGLLEIMQFLLEDPPKVEVDAKDKGGRTPLMLAAQKNHDGCVEFLIEKGAVVDCPSLDGTTALHAAVRENHYSVVSTLLAAKAKPGCQDKAGLTPLIMAAQNNHEDCLNLLLGQDNTLIHCAAKDGTTALHAAASKGNYEIVQELLKANADFNCRDSANRTPLMLAVQNSYPDTMASLIEARADLLLKNDEGRNVLHLAAMAGNPNIVQTLLAAKTSVKKSDEDAKKAKKATDADANQTRAPGEEDGNVNKTTPASANEARREGGESDAKRTGAEGEGGAKKPAATADADPKKGDGGEVAEAAAKPKAEANAEADKKAAEEDKIPVNEEDKNGWTAFMLASNKECAELLKEARANVQHRAKAGGTTALHVAAKKGDIGIMELILAEDGVSPDIQDDKGYTALMLAVENNHNDCVQLLVSQKNAQTRIVSNDESTALHMAARRGFTDIVNNLLVAGVDVDCKDKDGRTPLMLAAYKDFKDCVSLLLEASATVRHRSVDGSTALHVAASKGHKEVLLKLIAHSADLDAKDNDGNTPLMVATKYKHTECVQILTQELVGQHATKDSDDPSAAETEQDASNGDQPQSPTEKEALSPTKSKSTFTSESHQGGGSSTEGDSADKAVQMLQKLFVLPPWVPVMLENGLACLLCRMVQKVANEITKATSEMSISDAIGILLTYFTLPEEDNALLEVFAVPMAIIHQCYKNPDTNEWLARALVASYNVSVLQKVQLEDILSHRSLLMKNEEVFALLRDFLVDTVNQKPSDFFNFAQEWLQSRKAALSGQLDKLRRRMGFSTVHPITGASVVEPRLTRVMREFLMFLARRDLEEAYVTVHLRRLADIHKMRNVREAGIIPALDWLQKHVNFLPKVQCKQDIRVMGEKVIAWLSHESRHPFGNPALTVLKRISFHIMTKHSLPGTSPSLILDAEVILMHNLKMPLADLEIESGNTWMQKVGLFLLTEKVPSSHPMTGTSTVTGLKTTLNEAKGLIGRMSDKEIIGTFQTILKSGYGEAVNARLDDNETSMTYYSFAATMAHYLWYLPQKEALFHNVRLIDGVKLEKQLTEMEKSKEEGGRHARLAVEEKPLLLAMRNQHFLTALMEASLYGDVDIVRMLLKHGAHPNPPIQESVLPHVVEYLMDICMQQGYDVWTCGKCKDKITKGNKKSQLASGYSATAECKRCCKQFALGKGLNCPPCKYDCCQECALDILTGEDKKHQVLCPVCEKVTFPFEEDAIYDIDFICDKCDGPVDKATGMYCTCGCDICERCIKKTKQAVAPSPEKQVIRLLSILAKQPKFEVHLKKVWSQSAVLPPLTPVFLYNLEKALQAAEADVPTEKRIIKAISEVVPEFRWFPYSAVFFAHAAKFKDIMDVFAEKGHELTEFENDDLKRLEAMREKWLQGEVCCHAPSSGIQTLDVCSCTFASHADLFFLEFVRLKDTAQPDARTEFVQFLAFGLTKGWPDVFKPQKVRLWLARTRTIVLLQILQHGYGNKEKDVSPVNIAAIYLYTLESEIYQKLNQAFYRNELDEQKKWKPFTQQLIKALGKLPPFKFDDPPFAKYISKCQAASFRGLGPALDPSRYVEGHVVAFENFTSSSLSAYIAHSFGLNGTILVTKMKDDHYKMISRFSDFPSEQEFLSVPGTKLKVKKVYRSPNQKAAGIASSVVPLIYFYIACTQPNDLFDAQVKFSEDDFGYTEPNFFPSTLKEIYQDPVRSFELTFGHLSYNLVYLEECTDKSVTPNYVSNGENAEGVIRR